MKRVKDHRYLYRRGDQLYFRRGVPEDARKVVVSLGTSSVAQARHLLVRELARFDKLLAESRGRRSPAEAVHVRREPTASEMEQGIREWFSDRMERVHLDYIGADGIVQGQAQMASLTTQLEDVKRSLALGGGAPTQATKWIAEALIDRNSWQIEAGSPTERRFLRLVGRGQVEAAQQQMQELEGLPRKTIDDTFGADQYRLDEERKRNRRSDNPISFQALFDGYVAERKPAPATVKAWKRFVASFIEFMTHDDASRVSGADVVAWKEHLLQGVTGRGRPRSPRTVGDTYLAAIRTTFRWAVENHKIPTDPTASVGVRAGRVQRLRSKGLTDQEAETILKATLQPSPARLTQERRFARRWVPWLCAYTGARVNEMTQLRAEDVTQRDGIWTVFITPEAGSVKSNMARTVALHPHLLEQGFPAAVKGKSGPLFYDPARYKGGEDGHPQSTKTGEHLAAWVRSLGVDDPEVAPNHGWRHRFKSQAREVRMSEEVRDAIQGHAPRTEGEAYGDFSSAVTFREISLPPPYKV